MRLTPWFSYGSEQDHKEHIFLVNEIWMDIHFSKIVHLVGATCIVKLSVSSMQPDLVSEF